MGDPVDDVELRVRQPSSMEISMGSGCRAATMKVGSEG